MLDKGSVSTFDCDDKCMGPCCIELPECGPLDGSGILSRSLELVEGDYALPDNQEVGESDGVEEVDLLDEGAMTFEEYD